ncbi:helix-turn-helix domain-containing protein [Apibacter sp. HY039]|uniref:helix-turn-helix domain-containing protein n=1 Tax=Apibacter sp. HY039 TaxID=2501476 RepID=UPI000FEC0013|nr:helix-turn-helix domain-containing protein [Apibacter sp. HY039]
MTKPNYKKIFIDIIKKKCPEKLTDSTVLNRLNNLNTSLDIIEFNEYLFPVANVKSIKSNQRLKSFDDKSIMKILIYQKQNELSNSELANKFKLSRNSIQKWKKIFK